jgi:hypothetical protein
VRTLFSLFCSSLLFCSFSLFCSALLFLYFRFFPFFFSLSLTSSLFTLFFPKGCCAGETFDLNKKACCASKIVDGGKNKTKCCGDKPYDSKKRVRSSFLSFLFSCSLILSSSFLVVFRLSHSSSLFCPFDIQACCASVLSDDQVPEANITCCGNQTIPVGSAKLCCDSKTIYNPKKNESCCGSTVINLKKESCCNKLVIDTANVTAYNCCTVCSIEEESGRERVCVCETERD